MVKKSESTPRRARLVCALALLCAACTQVLGVEDAHVDPTFESSQAAAGSGGVANGSICKHFDNSTRLTKLLPDGGLAPLPSSN